jgi:predicted GNAT superfamily acetyltransferase
MAVEYRELVTEEDFSQATDLQRRVFGCTDLDVVPPVLLRLAARNNPPLGLHFGAFLAEDSRSQLVGVILGFATFLEGTVYTALMGVLAEYQEGMVGYRLLLKFREACLQKNIRTAWGVYEPMDPKLARLYHAGLGLFGVQYLDGKILFRWDFLSENTVAKVDRTARPPASVSPDPTNVVRPGYLPEGEAVLFEIEEGLSPGERETWGRTVLGEYLNVRGYAIVDCATARIGDQRKIYYVLRPEFGSCADGHDRTILNTREIQP